MNNRSAIQCLHRWSKILKPGIKKGSWSVEEDQKLKQWADTVGPVKWASCAKEISGRNGKQCRERYFNILNPNLNKYRWTAYEDYIIFQNFSKEGSKWSTIAKYIPGRSENDIKNRFYSTLRRFHNLQFSQNSINYKSEPKIRQPNLEELLKVYPLTLDIITRRYHQPNYDLAKEIEDNEIQSQKKNKKKRRNANFIDNNTKNYSQNVFSKVNYNRFPNLETQMSKFTQAAEIAPTNITQKIELPPVDFKAYSVNDYHYIMDHLNNNTHFSDPNLDSMTNKLDNVLEMFNCNSSIASINDNKDNESIKSQQQVFTSNLTQYDAKSYTSTNNTHDSTLYYSKSNTFTNLTNDNDTENSEDQSPKINDIMDQLTKLEDLLVMTRREISASNHGSFLDIVSAPDTSHSSSNLYEEERSCCLENLFNFK